MDPEEYKRLANVFSDFNKKYGNPSILKPHQVGIDKDSPDYDRGFYNPGGNYMVMNNKLGKYREGDEYKEGDWNFDIDSKNQYDYLKYVTRPDLYFQELAHAKQEKDDPIKSSMKFIEGKLFYEDNDNPKYGRYGVPGQLEHDAHEIIAPKLWQEFKTLYEKKYGKFPDQFKNKIQMNQKIKEYENLLKEEMSNNYKYNPKVQQQPSTTSVGNVNKLNLQKQPYVDDRVLTKLVLGSLDPNNIPKDKEKVIQLQSMLYSANDPYRAFNNFQHSIKLNPETQEYEFDGVYGPGTKSALIDYQKKNK